MADSDDVTVDGAAEGASMEFGGSEWLVPWHDGFLRFGFVRHSRPLPELTDEHAEDFFREWDAAVARQADLEVECAGVGEYPVGDHWVLATRDGESWLVGDLDDDASPEPYPQQAAVNGDLVLARLGDSWTVHTIG